MPETTYTIEVKTGHKGTNADIEIFLFGTKGTWKNFQLLDNPGRDDFEPNQIDTFTLIDDNDIGVTTDIAIRPRGAGLHHDNWKMDHITVYSDAPGTRESKFKERKRLFTGEAEPVMLRSMDFSDSGVTSKASRVVVKEFIVVENNFGGLATKDREEVSEIIEEDSLRVTDENFTSIKQSYELKRSAEASLEGLMKVASSLTFSGEIATSFKNQVASEKKKIDKSTKRFKYAGKDYHCNFFKFTDYEIRVIGEFNNPSLRSTKLQQSLEKHRTVEVKSFKAIDQILPGTHAGETFAKLWEASGRSLSEIPTSPSLAELEKNKS